MVGEVGDILIPNENVVGLWRFDEVSGPKALDSSGWQNNGNIFGATNVEGKKNNALGFDGIDDYVEIPDSSTLDITNQITILAWINLDELTGEADQNMVINKDNIAYEIAVHDNTGPDDGSHTCGKSTDKIPTYNFAFYISGLSGLPDHNCGWKDGGGPIQKNVWTHVAITYDGFAVRTYINGEVKKEYGGVSGTIGTTNLPVRIGARGKGGTPPPQTNEGGLFNGKIDEVKIYNIALTQDEILLEYTK